MSLIETVRAAARLARPVHAEAEDERREEEELTTDEGEAPAPEDEDEEEEPMADDTAEGAESAGDQAAERRARVAERQRIRAILGSHEASGNPALAAHLALYTSMSAARASAALKTAAGGFAAAMDRRGNPTLGTGAAGGGAKSADERLIDFARRQAEAKRKRRAF